MASDSFSGEDAGRGTSAVLLARLGLRNDHETSRWKFILIDRLGGSGLTRHDSPRQEAASWASTSRAGRSSSTRSCQENLPPNFNMDELISALKQRARPARRQEIPIRKIGSNRIEIILPQSQRRGGRGSQEDAHGRRARLSSASSPTASTTPPPLTERWARRADQAAAAIHVGSRWVRSQPEPIRRSPPTRSPTSQQNWKKDLYAGYRRPPDRQGHAREPDRPLRSRSSRTPPTRLPGHGLTA